MEFQQRATLTLGLCHGVFTDQFIFRHILVILGHFSLRKYNLHHVYDIANEDDLLGKSDDDEQIPP